MLNINKNKFYIFLFKVMGLLLLVWCNSCESNLQPKPHGYFRINFPEKKYQLFQQEQLSFYYPDYATILIDPQHNHKWIDITYPAYNATIHCSYHSVHHNFDTLTEDVRAFVMKHIPKASGIEQTLIEDGTNHVYGLIYDISGVGAASPCQFFLSDTIKHFFRGALYFNVTPNNDSLAPIIHFIRQDIDTLITSLKWNDH